MKNVFAGPRFGIDFEPFTHQNFFTMTPPSFPRRLLRLLHLLRVVAGVVLLAAFSWEILWGPDHHISRGYMHLQLAVCLLFLTDFAVGWMLAAAPRRYLLHHLFYLLCSVPWLNLIAWSGVELPRPWAVWFGMMPVWQLVLALYLLIAWLDTMRIHRLFVTYTLAVVLFTYLAALLFYEVEVGVNSGMHGFGDALWWAGVNLTTAGASLIPTTAVGKVLSVLLPLAGMLFLPIFTSYIMHRRTRNRVRRSDE